MSGRKPARKVDLLKVTIPASALVVGLTVSFHSPVWTGGGLDDDPATTNTTKKCKKGRIWDKKKKKCVRKSSKLDQECIFEAGRGLAKAERFEEAIGVLTLAPDIGDKRILNSLGYSHRKLGRIEVGLCAGAGIYG